MPRALGRVMEMSVDDDTTRYITEYCFADLKAFQRYMTIIKMRRKNTIQP